MTDAADLLVRLMARLEAFGSRILDRIDPMRLWAEAVEEVRSRSSHDRIRWWDDE